MTVQPRRPCDLVFIDREMELQPSAPGFLHPSAVLMPHGDGPCAAAAPKGAKRGRDAAGAPAAALRMGHGRSGNNSALFPPPGAINLQEEQNQRPTVVSTGLHLSSASIPPILSEDLAVQIKRENDEIEQFINAQGEHLRRTLAQRQRQNYCSLISAAKDSIARRLRQKEAELEQAARRSAELEDHLARLRTESMAWQAKAMDNQAKAASLHAQLQHATSAAATTPVQAAEEARRGGSSPSAEDAESAFVDPDRVNPERACRMCGRREAAAVLLPCRHLCLCEACDGRQSPVESCPVCRCVRTGSVRVFLA